MLVSLVKCTSSYIILHQLTPTPLLQGHKLVIQNFHEITTPHQIYQEFATTWEALLIVDLLIFGLTLFKTLKVKEEYSNTRLHSLVLRDGERSRLDVYLCG